MAVVAEVDTMTSSKIQDRIDALKLIKKLGITKDNIVDPTRPISEEEFLASLKRSEEDIKAGNVKTLEEVHAELLDALSV